MTAEDRRPQLRHCAVCGDVEFSACVTALVIEAPGMPEPLNLTPANRIRVCNGGKQGCDARWDFVTRCMDLHPMAREAHGPWIWAALVFADGRGYTLKAKRREVQALA